MTLVETQIGKKVKFLRSDDSGKYVSKAFQKNCDTKGIKREFIAPYNSPQNGVSKRMNKTIQEKIRSMLSNAELPNGFREKGTAVHLIDRSPNKKLELRADKELWTRKPP